jgi:hypothetical protein
LVLGFRDGFSALSGLSVLTLVPVLSVFSARRRNRATASPQTSVR